MPHEEPVMSDDAPTIDDETIEGPDDGGDEWVQEPADLPRRPHRHLLGTGANRVFVTLLGVLLIACGFIGGVLVEKSQTSSSSSSSSAASGFGSRLRALREGG